MNVELCQKKIDYANYCRFLRTVDEESLRYFTT